jgi:hypothetical protein
MAENTQLNSSIPIDQKLLVLRKELRKIELTNQTIIEHHAKAAVMAFPDKSENERQDYCRGLIHESFETFSVLELDVPTFLKEVRGIMKDSLENIMTDPSEGKDNIPKTVAQSIQLLKVLSGATGYTTEFVLYVDNFREKINLSFYWIPFLSLVRKKILTEYQKAAQIVHDLFSDAPKKCPNVTNLVINFDPTFGYETFEGPMEDYSEFRLQPKTASDKSYADGRYNASSRFLKIKNSMNNYDGVV